MAKKLCRYDYTVQAVEALSKYMESCATQVNTLKLIEKAHLSIHELQTIEEEINSKRNNSPKIKSIKSAFDEFEKQFSKLKPMITEIDSFLEENGKAFKEIKKIKKSFDTITETNKLLKQISSTISKRVAKPRQKAAIENDVNKPLKAE